MTRDTKIGLLIAVALILLISVVVTDYLSSSKPQQQPADLTRFGGAAERSVVGRTADSLMDWIAPPGSPAPGSSAPGSSAPGSETATGGNSSHNVVAPASDNAGGNGEAPERRPAIQPAAPTGQIASDYQPYRNPGEISPPETSRGGASIQPAGNANAQPTVHYVKAGETLYRIAAAQYGNGEYWRAIARANDDIDNVTGAVHIGQRIVLPNFANATASDARIADAASGNRGTASQVALMQVTRTRAVITAKSGDTLSAIAQQHLGSSKHWRLILEANRDLLRNDARNLKAGMKLVMPTIERIQPASAPAPGSAPGSNSTGTSLGITNVSNPAARPTLGATLPVNRETVVASVRPEQLAALAASRPSPFASTSNRTSSSTRSYTVRSGDTLTSIARAQLHDNSPNAWQRLYDANRSNLDDPNNVPVGTILALPER